MAQYTVEMTAESGLCSSCGICKNMCPKGCIVWERKCGLFCPVIDGSKCVKCGLCAKVCPGLGVEYPQDSEPLDAVYGKNLGVYNAWSKNPDLRHVSASGGVVSTIIDVLLRQGLYDVAFALDSYSYDQQLKTRPVITEEIPEDWMMSRMPKSRYLPVSHENAVQYLKDHRDKRIILIGTSCAIHGLRNVIEQLHRAPEQCLFIGLFCDKVFNYNVNEYFQNYFGAGKRIEALHFKNKDSGGWPGNMKLLFEDGTTTYLDKTERGKVKEYFMPERCMYCVDKLNICADISLGDNYTQQNSTPLGSNSVIIRNEHGRRAWEAAAQLLEFEPVEIEKLRWAQFLDGRLNNLYFAALKERLIYKKRGIKLTLNSGIKLSERASDYEQAWRQGLAMLRAGERYDENPQELEKQVHKLERRKNPKNFETICERIYYAIKRRVGQGVI